MQTDDIAAWLTQILKEDERAARAQKASADGWLEPPPRFGPSHGYVGAPVRPKFEQIIARIEADRQILELHVGAHDCVEIRTGTHPADWPESAPWGKPGGEWRHAANEHFEDESCPTVRLLALPHADRPGYQEAWRPARLL